MGYLRQKENKIRKSVNELSSRERRKRRKNWRQYSAKYRNKKHTIKFANENTPPESVVGSDAENIPPANENSRRRIEGKRRSAANRVRRHRKKKKTENEIKLLKQKLQKYKKRCNRLKQQMARKSKQTCIIDLTPKSRVEAMLDLNTADPRKVEEVKKSLLLGEVLKEQVCESYKTVKTNRGKQVMKKILTGKLIRKYKLANLTAKTVKFKSTKRYREELFKYERSCGKQQKL